MFTLVLLPTIFSISARSFSIGAALADRHAGLGAVDVHLQPGSTGGIGGALDLNLGDAGAVQTLLQHLADLVVLNQGVAELLLEVNQRLSQSLITPTRRP